MTTYDWSPDELKALEGKTILITGAATGIGRAALEIAHKSGANVAFGDWNEKESLAITQQLGERVFFQKCDVSKWDNVLSLFDAAWKKFGIIHAVLSNAGVNTDEDYLEDKFDEKTGLLLPPSLRSIDINLNSHIYVSKCALHYFKKWPETKCQVVMTSSAGAFFAASPIYMYCTAKAGVLGLMRSLRSETPKRNATINVVAPWLTITPMVIPTMTDFHAVTPMLLPDWLAKWGDLPQNSSEGAAGALLLPICRPEVNGKAFFVAGNKYIEFEESLHKAQPVWMGQKLSDQVNRGQALLLGEDVES